MDRVLKKRHFPLFAMFKPIPDGGQNLSHFSDRMGLCRIGLPEEAAEHSLA